MSTLQYLNAKAAKSEFENWWDREGKYLDPDTDDVSWFDKRKGLAALAFNAALVLSKAP